MVRRRPKDRRATIVRVAGELFAQRGYAAVGVADIAAKVDITPGALYKHFTSKEALLDAVLLDALDTYGPPAQEALAGVGADGARPPAAALEHVLAVVIPLTSERPAPAATYLRERHRASEGAARALAEREAQLFSVWAGAVAAACPGLSPAEIASRLRAVVGALVGVAFTRGPAVSPGQSSSTLTDAILRVLRAPPSSSLRAEATRPRPWTAAVSRRTRILDAALTLFRQHGYQGVGIDEIGAAAGIAGPTVYAYYDSKADILVDVYDLALARLAAGVADALAHASSARDALSRLARNYVDVAFDSVDLIAVASRETHALPEAERPRFWRRQRDINEVWRSVVVEIRPELSDNDARVLLRALFPMVNEVAQHRVDDGPSVEAVVDMVHAFLGVTERSS